MAWLASSPAAGEVVFLDPGHGGRDPGAVVEGIREKDVTLSFALAFAEALEATGFEVALSRRDDRFVPLDDRVALAREAGAAMFLSIHADRVTWGDASGVSLYRLSPEATDALAADLARQANAGGPGDDALAALPPDLRPALGPLVAAETEARTDLLADIMLASLGERVPMLSGRPLRGAAFKVLTAPDTPSLLLEIGFLSNAEDRARLRDPAWRAALVKGAVEGVERWFFATRGRLCATGACHGAR
jgi:N-acetylmuramoyl-L-alanine amidase